MSDVTSEHELIIRYLAGRDVACPRCEYNLRALTVPRCPECGEEIHLRVEPLDGGGQAWVRMMLAAAALWAPGLAFLALVVVHGSSRMLGWFHAACILSAVGGLMLLVFVLRRRAIVSRPSAKQRGRIVWSWIIAAVTWVYCLTLPN